MAVESWSSVWSGRKARRLGVACALAGVLLWASCGKLPPTSYYTLSIPAPPPAPDPKTSFVLGVERFRAPQMLRDDRIVYYQSPTEVNFYEYHRWTAEPATMLSELAVRWLTQMGLFAQVRLMPAREPVDYVLRGRVLSFEEVDYGSVPRGRVGLELTLVGALDQKVVWSATRQVEQPFNGKGVSAVVNALNASSEELMREVLPGLAGEIEREFKGKNTPAK